MSHTRENRHNRTPETPGFRPVGATVAHDEDVWVDVPSLGSVHDLSGAGDETPALLVPDGAGDYREHRPEPRRRLGF